MDAWLQIMKPKDFRFRLEIENTEEVLERFEPRRTACGQTQFFVRLPEAKEQVIEVTEPPSGLDADLVLLVATRNCLAGSMLV